MSNQVEIIQSQATPNVIELSAPGGSQGLPGPGVAAGGNIGQGLRKSGAGDYETDWADFASVSLAAGLAIALG